MEDSDPSLFANASPLAYETNGGSAWRTDGLVIVVVVVVVLLDPRGSDVNAAVACVCGPGGLWETPPVCNGGAPV
eukprot:scaffold46117_cov229-Amphora_coffeaeformis.AAC.1